MTTVIGMRRLLLNSSAALSVSSQKQIAERRQSGNQSNDGQMQSQEDQEILTFLNDEA